MKFEIWNHFDHFSSIWWFRPSSTDQVKIDKGQIYQHDPKSKWSKLKWSKLKWSKLRWSKLKWSKFKWLNSKRSKSKSLNTNWS